LLLTSTVSNLQNQSQSGWTVVTWKYMSAKKLTGKGGRSQRWRLESCSRRLQRVLQWCSSTLRRIDTEQTVPCIYMHTHSDKNRRHCNLQYSFDLSPPLH
jgi:hypothetical protein